MAGRFTNAVVGALVAASAVLALRALAFPALCRREAARGFGKLAGCLAGPARVSPEEAAIRARRLHQDRNRAADLGCAEHAEALARAFLVARGLPEIAARAATVAETLRSGKLDDEAILALWRSAETLPYQPPKDAAPPPAPLLDIELAAMRAAIPDWVGLRRDRDFQPLDRVELGVAKRRLVIGADADGHALASARWEPVVIRPKPAPSYTTLRVPIEGILVVMRYPLARGEVDVDRDARMKGTQSCRVREGQVVAIEMKAAVHVVLVREGAFDVWGSFPRAPHEAPRSTGKLGLSCGEPGPSVRLAWAEGEPLGPVHETLRGTVERFPDGQHRVFVVTCTPAGCATAREGVVRDLDVHWGTVGGWSSPWALASPDVLDLGARVLLVWEGGRALKYRLAPLSELDAAPSRWIVETHRPRETGPPDPRRVSFPDLQLIARGDAALLAIGEWNSSAPASFLVRFDASAEARVIAPPP